jgi:hypothetical protein
MGRDMSGLATNSLIVPDRSPQAYLRGRLPGETPHAHDDFFKTYTGYTEQTPTGSATWSTSRFGLSCVFEDQSGNDLAATLKPLTPSFPVTIESALSGAINVASNPGMGILFADGTSSTSNAAVFGGLSNYSLITAVGTLTSMGAGTPGQTYENRFLLQSPLTLIRLIWTTTNTFAWAISPDYGTSWTDWDGGTFSHTFTPTHIGFFATSWSGTVRYAASWPYLRVYEADLSV